MIELLQALERSVLWIETHPSIIAWLVGWFAALTITQLVKQLLPAAWSVTHVKRFTQTIAILVGGLVAFVLWPPTSAHGVVYALIIGMSAPTAYTGLKAIVCWRFPGLAYRLSWERVQERKREDDTP